MEIKDIIGKSVKVDTYQATFINLYFEGRLHRYDFIKKKEFRLKVGHSGIVGYFKQHPLLLDYNEPWATTYINSRPSNPESLTEEIRSAIDRATHGWRNWTNYVIDSTNFRIENFNRNVSEGNGRLLEAPLSITSSVIEVCNKYEVLTKSFEIQILPEFQELLLIGDAYVIAKAFKEHS